MNRRDRRAHAKASFVGALLMRGWRMSRFHRVFGELFQRKGTGS